MRFIRACIWKQPIARRTPSLTVRVRYTQVHPNQVKRLTAARGSSLPPGGRCREQRRPRIITLLL